MSPRVTWGPGRLPPRRPILAPAPTAPWRDFAGMQPVRSIREFRGVDKRSPFALHEGAATDAVNTDSEAFPLLRPRQGYRFWGPALPAPIRLARWWKLSMKMLGLANGVLYERPTTDAEAAWTQVATGLSTAPWYYTATDFIGNYSDSNVIITDEAKLWRYNGTSLTEIVAAPKVGGRTLNNLASHRNRLWGSINNRLYASALANAEDWTTAGSAGSAAFEIDVPGEAIIRAVHPLAGHLLVATRHSLWDLAGTGPDNWTLYNISEAIGVEGGHNSVCEVGGVLYWIAYDGIYRYAGGVAPDKDFSAPVMDYVVDFIRADFSVRVKACATTDGRHYILALPQGASATAPTRMLVYDTLYGIWHVWDFGVEIHSAAYSPGVGFMAFGGGDGRLRVQMGHSTHGFREGDNDPNAPLVPWRWVSRPFGAGPLSAQHWWYRLWLVVDVPSGATLNIYVSPKAEGDDSWVLVGNVQPQATLQEHRIVIPIPVLANANWVRVKLEGTGGVRVHSIDFQERVLRHGIEAGE